MRTCLILPQPVPSSAATSVVDHTDFGLVRITSNIRSVMGRVSCSTFHCRIAAYVAALRVCPPSSARNNACCICTQLRCPKPLLLRQLPNALSALFAARPSANASPMMRQSLRELRLWSSCCALSVSFDALCRRVFTWCNIYYT